MKINVYKYIKRTNAEGPGKRFCLWVQGCSRKCKGCFAKETWSHNPNKIMNVDEIFSLIMEQKNIEGVTFLGGEPFEQAKPLAQLAKMVVNAGLSVVTFTGNTYEALKKADNNDFNELLKYTDLLIDGGFDEEKFDLSRPWVGSKNQRYICLTDRYNEEEIKKHKNKIEVRIEKNGYVFINGMGDFKAIERNLCLQCPKNSL